MMAKDKGNKITNVPNLRFPEFEGEWETCAFSDIGTFFKGIGISKEQLTEEGTPGILYGELYTKYKNEVIKEVKSKTSINTNGLVFSKSNDVIIPSSGETAIDISTACCVTLDNILLGGDLNIIRPKKHNGSFISYQLNGKRKYDIAKIAQGSSIIHLYNDSLKKVKINVPNDIREEEKIVSLLSKIDDRISSQSQIIEELKSLKKSMSNKLIYNNKSLDKKIKLSDIGEVKNGYAFTSTSYEENGKYKVITIANVTGERDINALKCSNIVNLPKDIQHHQVLKKNDILISLTGNVGRVSLCNVDNALLNQRVGLFVPNNLMCVEYIFQAISNQKFEKTMIACGKGAAQMNISKSDIENHEIPYSINEKPLLKISSLLKKLDEKLETEKQLLKKYTEQKKYLLANMFI